MLRWKSSFFEKEEERKLELVKSSLLTCVLEKLPFLRLTEHEKLESWEQVAIRVMEIFPQEELKLNGLYCKTKYESWQSQFDAMYVAKVNFVGPDLAIRQCDALDEVQRTLLKLNRMKNARVDTMAKVSEERYENYIRSKCVDSFVFQEEEVETEERSSVDLSVPVLISKLNYIQKQLDQKESRITLLEDENKRLQELNLELLHQLKK